MNCLLGLTAIFAYVGVTVASPSDDKGKDATFVGLFFGLFIFYPMQSPNMYIVNLQKKKHHQKSNIGTRFCAIVGKVL